MHYFTHSYLITMKMKRNKIIWLLTFILTVYLFNIFAYEIEAFNATVRNFIVTGNTEVRKFDEKGIPLSSNPNIKSDFISPFYVVHYGLIYSELHKLEDKNEFHWKKDSSIEYWNIPPKKSEKEYFKNCVDWLVDNLDTSTGYAHFMYDFDWPYKGYPGGILKKSWWSGLTDAYAIVLMLRAYDVYQDERYLEVSRLLYESSLQKVSQNGSLTYLNDKEWIEEYVDPSSGETKLAYVLNGMIYSTFGIKAFEDKFQIENPHTDKLLKSIETNINLFDKGSNWSNYDLIGNRSNMKYHKIHVALMHEMYDLTKSEVFKNKENQWRNGVKNIGLNWVINSNNSMAKKMYLFELISLTIGFIIIYYRKIKK